MAEYGIDVADVRAWEDETMTIEVPIDEIPEDVLKEILGGTPIVRCRNCKHRRDYPFREGVYYCSNDRALGRTIPPDLGLDFFCALGKLI